MTTAGPDLNAETATALPPPARDRTLTWLTVSAALALIGLLLARPTPTHHDPAVAGTATLDSGWPAARPFTIPAVLPDGSAYTPAIVLDAGTSVGVSARTDRQYTDLTEVTATGPPRLLQTQLATDAGSFDGITATADHLYWMHTLSDPTSQTHTTLWTADRAGGPARQVSADVGNPILTGSGYDVQPVGNHLYWAATRPATPPRPNCVPSPSTAEPWRWRSSTAPGPCRHGPGWSPHPTPINRLGYARPPPAGRYPSTRRPTNRSAAHQPGAEQRRTALGDRPAPVSSGPMAPTPG